MDLETKYNLMKTGGEILSEILINLKENIKPGINGDILDKLAEELIYSFGAKPAFKNYQAPFAKKPYLYTICLSLNEIIVHGYPTKELVGLTLNLPKILQEFISKEIGKISKSTKTIIIKKPKVILVDKIFDFENFGNVRIILSKL